MNKNNTGISNSAALDKFYHSIKSELNIAKSPRNFSAGLHSWLRDAYQYNSPYSPFCWTSALIIFIEILALMLFHGYGSESFRLKSMAAEIFFLFLLLFMNIVIVGCDSWFRHTEMYAKAKTVLEAIEECKKQCPWDVGLYSHLHTPQSPCISSQWTYRNGELVNLPNHLLVEGDIILLRPGHAAPGNCKSIDKQFDTPVILNGGKVFAPVNEHLNESFSVPQARKPAKPAAFSMLETPYVKNFKLALQNSLNRPVTLFNKESHTVLFQYVERITIPVVLMITICVGGLHSAYFSPESSEWIKHLILRPALSILPLLPLALPIYWIILNAYGNARLLAIVEITKQEAKPLNIFEEMEEFNPPTVTCISFQELKPYFLSLLLQRRGYLWRSANLLHVLGSITALCCVDKKGILSWPNPTAEKVFFLKPSKSKSNSQDSSHLEASCDNLGESPGDTIESKSDSIELKKLAKISKRTDVKDHMYHPSSQVEVLDLTHNTNSPFGIQFDDPNWKSYIGNLKPLGLAILLNTCNPKAQEHYTRFSDHIACESLYNCAAVPVVNKRCLCELAKQIGFTNSVVDFYDLEQQLGVFRHVHPEVIQKGRLARSLNFPRLKMPFPNISCAIVKDLHRGSHQLFSQGTANLVLDACNEYWDGEDISVLMESDRKRILDFYHRSSLTAHCMGYAYGPISMPLSGAIPDAYMELPADGGHLYKSNSAVQNSARSWENHHSEKNSKNIIRNRCLSSDSLILSDPLGDGTTKNNSITKYCVEQIGNEIFIGMVTMQYQACPDFVQLIEELDKACIRFVHFSKENELRSRVFSEKMGLESGWNCHISLLSENPRQDATGSAQVEASVLCQRKLSAFQSGVLQPENSNRHSENPLRSVSAPSVINLDTTVVKFEDEISMHSKSDFSAATPNVFAHREQLGSNVSVSVTDASSPHMHDSVSSIHDVLFSDDYHPSHSPSHITESTDQSAPVTFDMSNRAKLPKGTENIRPHIENIDNVPLQVSLFTDCTPEATREMICIMQEYGEVVCCLGSAANCQNMPIFLQADVSIAIEPLFPQLCVQQPVFDAQPYEQDQSIGPTDLSHILNSLPCSLSFHRENPISLYHLIMEARHFMSNMRSSFQFLLCCCLSVSLLQILAVVFFLPVPLSLGQLLWLNCLAIPLLSLSLMGNSADSQVTSAATGKNLKVISKQTVIFFIACYCAKFCPSVVAAIFCFACIVASTCEQHSSSDVPVSESCWIFTKIGKQGRDLANKESWSVGLIVAQNMVFFLMLLYFVLISAGFVHRSRLLWNGSPLTNRYWALTAPLVICLQAIFITADISLHASEAAESLSFLKSIPFYVWLIGLLWPFCLIPLNELVKRHEIKMIVRQQKRARLEFCTKLGMNSPF